MCHTGSSENVIQTIKVIGTTTQALNITKINHPP